MQDKEIEEKKYALDVRKLTRIYMVANDFSTSKHVEAIAILSEGAKGFESLAGELGINANDDYEAGWLKHTLKDLLLRDIIEINGYEIKLTKSGNITYQIMKVISDDEEIEKLLSQLFS